MLLLYHILARFHSGLTIYEGLVNRGFLIRKKKQLLPTDQGRGLIKLLPLSLTSPKLTVEWETRLQRMAQGKESPESFMQHRTDHADAETQRAV